MPKLRLKLDTVRSKILVFALTVAVIPSGLTAWISYTQNSRALEAKIKQELLSSSGQAAREMDIWLKERLYDLRVFASSYEVSEKLSRRRPGSSQKRLSDYLTSVRDRFSEYEDLVVFDPQGRPIAATGPQGKAIRLPPEWAKELSTNDALVGQASWDESLTRGVLVVAVPVERGEGRVLGALAARLSLHGAQRGLRTFAPNGGQAFLITISGDMLVGTSAEFMKSRLKPGTLDWLKSREGLVIGYQGLSGAEVVGSLKQIPRAKWAVVSEIPAEAAFQQITRFRNLTLLMVCALLLAVGFMAYRLGIRIVRPLERLIQGAVEVADGDLAVDLPAATGEVGELTDVFNHMVARLRQSRQELDAMNDRLRKQNEDLERLSTSDSLTGLYNRRYLTQRLSEELLRSYRHKGAFSVLIADVDEFKKYNDAFGHPAGDEVLKKVASILLSSTRSEDCTARYGGEEFAVLLTGTSGQVANEVAERIRARVESHQFAGRKITLSIGIAEFPNDGETAEEVIANADEALYTAKRAGRNRVVRAGTRPAKVKGKA